MVMETRAILKEVYNQINNNKNNYLLIHSIITIM